jgi:hypothetical protein
LAPTLASVPTTPQATCPTLGNLGQRWMEVPLRLRLHGSSRRTLLRLRLHGSARQTPLTLTFTPVAHREGAGNSMMGMVARKGGANLTLQGVAKDLKCPGPAPTPTSRAWSGGCAKKARARHLQRAGGAGRSRRRRQRDLHVASRELAWGWSLLLAFERGSAPHLSAWLSSPTRWRCSLSLRLNMQEVGTPAPIPTCRRSGCRWAAGAGASAAPLTDRGGGC